MLEALGTVELELAWARQVHSDRALDAAPGNCGEGDALVTDRSRLALSIATADCVPVVITDGERLAAVHAGWRGVASMIVARTIERLDVGRPLFAWLGPAIGACCYEVGTDVAERVVSVSHVEALIDRPEGRPHLDLHEAIARQLEPFVFEVRRVGVCTRCHPEALSSFRRDGKGAGRNLTFAWLAG